MPEELETEGRGAAVSDVKQACLDLSKAAVEMFDLFDEHGLEAAWVNPFAVKRLMDTHEAVRSFLSGQVTRRMLALGMSPETLARVSTEQARG